MPRTLAVGLLMLAGAPFVAAFADKAPIKATAPPAQTSMNFPQDSPKPIRERIAGKYASRSVAPHWSDDGDSFWYRVDKGDSRSEFVFVDAAKKTRGPAFDHAKLAELLTKELKKPVSADKLPFSSISVAPDGSWTRFRAASKVWQFGRDGSLAPTDANLNEERLAPLKAARASSKTGDETAITFVNRTPKELGLFWLDLDGKKQAYGTIAPNATFYRGTFAGHVWQVFDGDKPLGAWEAPDEEALVVLDGTVQAGEDKNRLAPLKTPRASVGGGGAANVTIVNRLPKEISLFWLDLNNKKQDYGTVAPGASFKSGTFVGHVWEVFEGTKLLGAWEVSAEDSLFVVDGTNAGSTGADKPQSERKDAPTPIDAAPKKPAPRAFVKDYNLWMRGEGGKEKQLTTSGTKENAFGNNLYLSPDGRHAVAWQVAPEQQHTVTLVDSSPKDQKQPKVKTIQYLKPGDRVQVDRPRLFDLDEAREIPTSDKLFANPWNVENLGWNEAGDEYHFSFNERGHQNYRVLGMKNTGAVRAIVDEHSDTFIDYSGKTYLREMPETGELIWASERDGWNHLYLYDVKAGAVKNKITTGDWVVREVEKVDEAKRQIWFRGLGMVPGQDPYYAQLARVNFDGTDLTMLTEGDGDHKWKWSPDEKYLIDTYSRVDMAPVTNLRDANGKLVTALETANFDALKQADWSVPQRFVAKGRDGKTDIYGIITVPSNFDPTKKYPVIEQIYAGPQSFYTPKSFTTADGIHTLADRGYVVVQIDGMGTNWRSKAFHDVAWKNLKDAGFPDRIAWMKAAQTTRPWMDLSRVGVYGGSAGGQNAMAALIWHGDFYKVAAADCGCHDNRMDKIWWNEQWMGWPIDKSYADSSNVDHAAEMQGHLLLTVGELDTNVDPASTTQVIDALIQADKDFDYIIFPGANHGAGGSPYGVRRRNEFFDRWLMPAKN